MHGKRVVSLVLCSWEACKSRCSISSLTTSRSFLLTSSPLSPHSVCVASVVRIYELTVFMATPDVLWTMGPVFIWSSVEPSVAIFSACLPCLPPLVRLCREKASRSGSKGASLGYEHHSLGHSLSGWRKEPPRFALASAGRSEDEVQLTSMAVGGGVSHPNRNEMSRTGIMVESSIVQSAHAI